MSNTQTHFPADARAYRPRGAAERLFYCRDREVLIDGPAGTGKTRACLEKVHLLAQEIPKLRALLVRKTRTSMTQSVLVTFEEKVLPAGSHLSKGPQRWYRHSYRYPNGAEVVTGGLDNVERIMSSEYDIIVVFEATEITENDWEMLLTRLRNHVLPFQQQIADCNPSHPRHWLIERARQKKMTRLPSRHEDNPSLTSEYLEGLAQLSGHRRSRLFEGVWAAAEGLVYPAWESAFRDHFDPSAGRLTGGIDFGWTNPFAALGGVYFAAGGSAGTIYVWYERYRTKTLLRDHAAALPADHLWEADPSAPQQIAELRRAGHRVRPAANDIVIGINAINARIEDGTLLISRRCRALAAEMSAYQYGPDGASEQPLDEFNHACDALRYLVMGIDRGRVAAGRIAQEPLK